MIRSGHNRRHIHGCHFGWTRSRSCPAPSRNAVMGRLWHMEVLPLLSHQLNRQRIWGGMNSCFALCHAFLGSDATPQFREEARSQPVKQRKHIRQPLLGLPARLMMDLFLWNLHLQHSNRLSDLHVSCIMYASTTYYDKVNDLRQELFQKRGEMMEKLPPTETALLQHVNRCLYQASIWRSSLKPIISAFNL